MNPVPWNSLSPERRRVFDVLFSRDFPGRDALLSQLKTAMFEEVDEYGSLQIAASTGTSRAHVVERIPVEARGLDSDGIPVCFLLHVVDGLVTELQIYKADGSAIQLMPSADSLSLGR